MPYSELTAKTKRTVEWDVKTLFSLKAFVANPSWEDVKQFGLERPSIKYKRGTHFLSDAGVEALTRLTRSVGGLTDLAGLVSSREIANHVLSYYNELLVKSLQPTGREFVDEVVSGLLATVRNYQFLILIEGLDLKDQEKLDIGSLRICHPNRAMLDHVKFEGSWNADTIFEQFRDNLWLLGASNASTDIASEKFEHLAVLAIGVIAVCGALLYRGAIWRSRVRAVLSPLENRKAVYIFRWESSGDNPSLTRRSGSEQNLPLDSKSIAQLTEKCFLKQLGALLDLKVRTELQDAIVRSLYWFSDAYKDRNPAMQFVKLWTCVEGFFSTKPGDVTDLISSGFAAILTFAGFQISDVKNYVKLKRRIKILYDFRSTAVHRASISHIVTADLNDLSYWVAWVIVCMISLAERGYRTLQQIQEHTSRLDGLAQSANTGA